MSRLSDRDCGCAHHWNCKGLAPSGVKPVLRPAQTAVADAAVQAEREACAKLAEEYAPSEVGELVAEAIRARGES